MSTAQNQAAWLPGVGQPLEIRPAPLPVPVEGELLVKVCQILLSPNPNWLSAFRGCGEIYHMGLTR